MSQAEVIKQTLGLIDAELKRNLQDMMQLDLEVGYGSIDFQILKREQNVLTWVRRCLVHGPITVKANEVAVHGPEGISTDSPHGSGG